VSAQPPLPLPCPPAAEAVAGAAADKQQQPSTEPPAPLLLLLLGQMPLRRDLGQIRAAALTQRRLGQIGTLTWRRVGRVVRGQRGRLRRPRLAAWS
jgi:hypothetical protein